MYEGHYIWGMHLIWWFIWMGFVFWIYATPWDFPGQRKKKDSPLDILKKRYAEGVINTEEFEAKKKILDQ